MMRTQIYLDEAQSERLAERAAASGVTKSHLIREAIDAYLQSPQDEDLRLARFRAAVEAVAGIAPYLPAGRSYVETVRRHDARRQQALERRRE